MYNLEIEKKQRRKVVLIASAMVAVILLLIVAIVVVATNKSTGPNVGGIDNAEFVITGNADEKTPETPKADTKTDTTVAASNSTASKSAEKAEDLPSTGPEDLAPLALALGGLTTAGVALVMKRQ